MKTTSITFALLGKVLIKPRMRELCKEMELEEQELRLVVDRFSTGKTIEQCDYMSKRQQFAVVPILNDKLDCFFKDNLSFFTYTELDKILKQLICN